MDTKSDDTIKEEFYCEVCDYKTCHRGHWKKHISTRKHKTLSVLYVYQNRLPKMTTPYSQCVCICGKQYNHPSSLSRHRATCRFIDESVEKLSCGKGQFAQTPKKRDSTPEPQKTSENLVVVNKKTLDLMEENSRLKDSMITVLQSKPNIVSNGDNATINTNHNTLNVNVFLDQNYAEAMNIGDFVQNIQCSVDDLNTTAAHGYVKGVSSILLKNLKVMDPKSRPIHCGDIKGTQIYIRDDDKWERDGGKLESEIDNVAKKQITMVSEWERLHPDWHKDEKLTHQYLNMVRQLTASDKDGGNEQIKRNVAKTVLLDEIMSPK